MNFQEIKALDEKTKLGYTMAMMSLSKVIQALSDQYDEDDDVMHNLTYAHQTFQKHSKSLLTLSEGRVQSNAFNEIKIAILTEAGKIQENKTTAKEAFKEVLLKLADLLNVVNSQNRQLEAAYFVSYSQDQYDDAVVKFGTADQVTLTKKAYSKCFQ